MSVSETLEKWYEAKEKIAILEQRIEKYKESIQREMKRQNVSKLQANGYAVTRRSMARSYLSKDSVPSDIWKRYAVQSQSDAYYITREKSFSRPPIKNVTTESRSYLQKD